MSGILSAVFNSKLDLLNQEKKGSFSETSNFLKSEKARLSFTASKKAYSDDKFINGFSHLGSIRASASSVLDFAVQKIGGGQSSGDVWHSQEKNILLIAFKGTDNATDLIADLGIMDKIRGGGSDFEEGNGKVHSGFYKTMKGMKSELDDIILKFPDAEIIVTGHSLGGAVAELYGQTLDTDNVEIISIGAPQVGDQEFKKNYSKSLSRIIHHADIITTGNFGYVHPSNKVYEVGLSSDSSFSSLKFHGLEEYEKMIHRFDDLDNQVIYDNDSINYSNETTVQILNFSKKSLSAFEVYIVLDDLYKNYHHVFLSLSEVDSSLSTFFHTHFQSSEILDEFKSYLQKVYIENSDPKLVNSFIENIKRDVDISTKNAVKGVDKTKAVLNNIDVQESWLLSKLTTGYENMFKNIDEIEFDFFSNVEGEAFRQEQELVKYIEQKKIEMKQNKFVPSPLRELFEKRIEKIVEKEGEKIAKTIRRGKVEQLDKITESVHWIGKTQADFEKTGWLINEPRDVFVQTPFHGTEGHKLGVAYRESDEMLIFSFPPATSDADKSSAIAGLVKFKEGQEGKVPFRYGKGKVHGGFQSMYDAFHDEMESVLKEIGDDIPIKKVHFTGHSMGGTMAQFALGDDLFKSVEKSAVLFGAPPIGDKEFVKSIDTGTNVKHFFHRYDPVPRLFATRFNKIRATEIDLHKSGDTFTKDLSGKMSDLYHRENGFEKMINRFTNPDDSFAIIEQSPFSRMSNKIKDFTINNEIVQNLKQSSFNITNSTKFKKVWSSVVNSKSFIFENIRFAKANVAKKILDLLSKDVIEDVDFDDLIKLDTNQLDETIHQYTEFGDDVEELATSKAPKKISNYVDVDAVDFSVDDLPEVKERIPTSVKSKVTPKGSLLKLNKDGVIEEWFEFAEDSDIFDDAVKSKMDEILEQMKGAKKIVKLQSKELGVALSKKLKGSGSILKKAVGKNLKKNLAKAGKLTAAGSVKLGKSVVRNLGAIGVGVDLGFTINDIFTEENARKMEEGTITFKGKERNAYVDFAGERIYHAYEPEAFSHIVSLKMLYAKLAKTDQIPKDVSPDSFAMTWMGRLSEDKDGNMLVDGKPIGQVDMNVEYQFMSQGRINTRPSRSQSGIISWNVSKFFLTTVITMGPQAVVGIPVAIGLGFADDIDKQDQLEFRQTAFGRAMRNALSIRITQRVFKEFQEQNSLVLTDNEKNELFHAIHEDLLSTSREDEEKTLRKETANVILDVLSFTTGYDLRFDEQAKEARSNIFSRFGLTDTWQNFKDGKAQAWMDETISSPMEALARVSNWENETNIKQRLKEINDKLGGDPRNDVLTRIGKEKNIGKTFRYAIFEDNQIKIKTITITREFLDEIKDINQKIDNINVTIGFTTFKTLGDLRRARKEADEEIEKLKQSTSFKSLSKESTEAFFTWKYYQKRYPNLKVVLDKNDNLVFLPKSFNKSTVMASDPENMIDVISQIELARETFPDYEIKLDGKGGWIATDEEGNNAEEEVRNRIGLINQIDYLKSQFPDFEFEIKDNEWVASKNGKDSTNQVLAELYQRDNPEFDVKIDKNKSPIFFKNGRNVTKQLVEMDYFRTNYENIDFEISGDTGLWEASMDGEVIKNQDIYFLDYIKTNFPDIDSTIEGGELKAFFDEKDVLQEINKHYYYETKYKEDYLFNLREGKLVVLDKQKNDITKHIGTIDYVLENYPDTSVEIEKGNLVILADPLYKLKDGTILRKKQFDSLVRSGNLKKESAIELPGHDVTDKVKRVEYFKRILTDVNFEIVNKENPLDEEQESEIKAFDKEGKSIDFMKRIQEELSISPTEDETEFIRNVASNVNVPSGVSNLLTLEEQPEEKIEESGTTLETPHLENFSPTGKPLRHGMSNNTFYIELEDNRIIPYTGNKNTVFRNTHGNWIGTLPNANDLPINTLDGYFMAFHVEHQLEEFEPDQNLERLRFRITNAIQLNTISSEQNFEEFKIASKILFELKERKSLRALDTILESENINIVLETSILESFAPFRTGVIPDNVNVPSNMNIEDSPTNPLKRAIEVSSEIGDSLMNKKFRKIEQDYHEFLGLSQQYLSSAKQAQQGSKPSSLDRTILEQSVIGESLEEFLAKQIKLNLSKPLNNVQF